MLGESVIMLNNPSLGWSPLMRRCAIVFKRFSKSIDTTKSTCGTCKSQLTFLGKYAADGSQAKSRAATPYSSFVQRNFAAVKAAQAPGTPHRDVMRELSNRWHEVQSDQ